MSESKDQAKDQVKDRDGTLFGKDAIVNTLCIFGRRNWDAYRVDEVDVAGNRVHLVYKDGRGEYGWRRPNDVLVAV